MFIVYNTINNGKLLQLSILYLLKLRSHRANGREMDKKLFYPFESGRIRFMSVSNPVNQCVILQTEIGIGLAVG